MIPKQINIFEYLDYRAYIRKHFELGPRGLQTQLAGAMKCQASYLIKVLKGESQLTEEQTYRGGRFLNLPKKELEYFLDLVRYDKTADLDLKRHLEKKLIARAAATHQVQNRVDASSLESSLLTQIKYYSSWQPSILHLATSCRHLQTEKSLAARFSIEPAQLRTILEFLKENTFISYANGKYKHLGNSIHLAKDSPLHKPFQRTRRELALQSLEQPKSEDLHFSSAFATSKRHIKVLRESFLKIIEESHQELADTDSEEIVMLVLDFFSP